MESTHEIVLTVTNSLTLISAAGHTSLVRHSSSHRSGVQFQAEAKLFAFCVGKTIKPLTGFYLWSQHTESNRGPHPSLTPAFRKLDITGLDCILHGL